MRSVLHEILPCTCKAVSTLGHFPSCSVGSVLPNECADQSPLI
ncbi:unnamed protein product, partial [Larinioides sclopetarius]